MNISSAAATSLFAFLSASSVLAGAPGHSVCSNDQASLEQNHWVGTWATAPQSSMPDALDTYRNQSVRLIVHASIGGSAVRVTLSNLFGDQPLRIGDAHVARRAAAATIDPTSDRPLHFAGRSSVTIPPRSAIVSDPVRLEVPALSDLAVSLFFPATTRATTSHFLTLETSYRSLDAGDSTASVKFQVGKTITSWPVLTGVDVEAPAGTKTLVAFGDSTVDGDGATDDASHGWPALLAARLQRGGDGKTGVLNLGMIGNRLLQGSPLEAVKEFGQALGQAGVARFSRDALAQAGVDGVIIRLGINDIGFPGALSASAARVTAKQLIAGYRLLIASARDKGVRIIGTTLSAFEGANAIAGYYTPDKDRVRNEVNDWIRSSGEFDAVVDLDAVLRDPSHPSRLLPDFDSGDHLHTNDLGYVATANAIPLQMLENICTH